MTEIEEFLIKHTLGSSLDVAETFTKMWCPSGDFPEYSRVASVSRTEAWGHINMFNYTHDQVQNSRSNHHSPEHNSAVFS